MKKIVTFRAASMGDTLMAKFLFENLRANHPDAKYVIVTSKNISMLQDLLVAYPWIEIVEINRKKVLRVLTYLWYLKRSDLVIIPASQGFFSSTSKLFARIIAKPGSLWGYEDGSLFVKLFYSHKLKVVRNEPIIENELKIIRALGEKITFTQPSFLISSPNPSFVTTFGLSLERYVVINLFSGSNKRGLSPINRQRLIDLIFDELHGTAIKIVLTGGVHNVDELKRLNIPSGVVVHTGPVSEMLNLLLFSLGVVSLDTGVAHISSGMKKPLLVLCSYAARSWWTREHHPETTTIIIGEPGQNEKSDKTTDFPESLNNFKDDQIQRWIIELKQNI